MARNYVSGTRDVNPYTGFVMPGQGGQTGVTTTAVSALQLGPITASADSPLGGLFAWMRDLSRNFAAGVEAIGSDDPRVQQAVNDWYVQQGAEATKVPGRATGGALSAIGAAIGGFASGAGQGLGTGVGEAAEGVGTGVGEAITAAGPGVGTGVGAAATGAGQGLGTAATVAGPGIGTGLGAGLAGIGSGLGSAIGNAAPGLTAGLGNLFGGTGSAYAIGFVAFVGIVLLLFVLR